MRKILSSEDIEKLEEGVCEVLEKVGFYCENDEMLKAYGEAGAKVDFENKVAKFPARNIKGFAEAIRREDKSEWDKQVVGHDRMVIYSGYTPYNEDNGLKQPPLPYMFHNLSTYYHDDEKNEKRIGNINDFIELIKFGDTVHPQNGMGHALSLVEGICPEIEQLEAALVLLEYSINPTGVYVQNLNQLEYLFEIEEIAGIKDPYWHWMANIPCSSPLKIEKVVCERYVYMVKTGIYPAKLTAMPVAGVNIPITTAGSVVIMAAEFIVLWLAARLIQSKKIPLVGMPVSGTMDMKKCDISFTAFDAAITRLSVCDFIKQWTGVKLSPGPGEWTPVKQPSVYNTLEKAYFAMLSNWYTGCHPDIGVGHIDSGLTISPVQFLLDLDFTRSLKHLESPKVNRDTMGIDTILDIGFGKAQNFLSSDHTIEHMKCSSWAPEFFTRCWSPENERKALSDALRRVREFKAAYRKPEGREDILAKSKLVVERARKKLCK